jgi:transcriptional regulator with XRE-family HTH domain
MTNSNIKVVVGLNVRRLRLNANLSQEALSEKAEVFRTYLARIESGHANPTLVVLHGLARGLGVSVAEVVAE